MARTTHQNSNPAFVVDWNTEERDNGHQVNWAAFGEEYRTTAGVAAFTVEVTANAEADAETVAVVALDGPIPSGTVLDFGGDKFVRLADDADAGATSLTTDPL